MKSLLPLLLVLPLLASAAGPAPAPEPAEPAPEQRNPHCLRETGSRIPRPEGECIAASGRVIDADELDHRAHTDLARHLRDLHPGINLGP